jgi:predicted nucleotide-binding protein (sugar kinase/HSP70/actin superfamily)
MDKFSRTVMLPHFGSYYVAFSHLITRGLEQNYLVPPPMTKRTLALGSRYSPDYVCAPFKYTLGCMLEGIEAGADTVVQTGGLCRLGYYGELQEEILRELGHEVRFVNLCNASFSHLSTFLRVAEEISPGYSHARFVAAAMETVKMVEYLDRVEDFCRKNEGFELEHGAFRREHQAFLNDLEHAGNMATIHRAYRTAMARLQAIPSFKPEEPLRVGIVGEYFTIMDREANHNLEQTLAGMGVELHRWMNFTNTLIRYPRKALLRTAAEYVHYDMGATSPATVAKAVEWAKAGFDGLIHVKSFGCTPEVDAVPVLQNISADYHIPILYFSFDSQSGDAGIQTRLEAFYDMIAMKKEAKTREKCLSGN